MKTLRIPAAIGLLLCLACATGSGLRGAGGRGSRAYDRYLEAVSAAEARAATDALAQNPKGKGAAAQALILGRFRFGRRDYLEASALFLQSLQEDPQGPGVEQARYLLGLCHMETQNPMGALEIFEELFRLSPDPDLAARCLNLSEGLIRDRLDEAQLQDSASRWPHSPLTGLALYTWGRKAYEGGRYEDSIKALSGFLTAYPLHPSYDDAERMFQGAGEILETRVLRIGLLAPLSGRLSGFGDTLRKGVATALKEYEGTAMTIERDTGGDPARALTAARALVDEERVSLLIGPATSSEVEAVAGYLDKAQIPMIAPFAGKSGLMDLSPCLFRTKLTSEEQMKLLASAAMAQGLRKVGVLAPKEPPFEPMAKIFGTEIEKQGGLAMATGLYDPVSEGPSQAILNLGGVDPSELKEKRRAEDKELQTSAEGLARRIRAGLASSKTPVRLALIPLPERGEAALVSRMGEAYAAAASRALASAPNVRLVADDRIRKLLEDHPRDPREEGGDLAVWIISAGGNLGADWVVIIETSQEAAGESQDATAPVSVVYDVQGVDVHTGQVSLTFQDEVQRQRRSQSNPLGLDAVLVLGEPDRDLVPVAAQLDFYGLNVPILGLEEWGLPRVLRLLRDQAEGIYFLSPFTPQSPLPSSKAFMEAYKALNDESPDMAFYAQAYEAAKASLEVFKAGARSPQAIQKALRAKPYFEGPGGHFRFLSNGDVTRDLPLYLIRGGQVILAPTPSPTPNSTPQAAPAP